MPFEQRIERRYHTQDRSDSCGAAITTMILRHFGFPYEELDQCLLHTTLLTLTNLPGVSATPEALSWLLNEKSGRLDFFSTRARSFAELNRRIVDSILRRVTPIAVPITQSAHWVLVDGFQSDVDPTAGAPYSLRGVWIHNPVPNSDGPPPPHGDNDDCGAGVSNRGVIKEFVTSNQWRLDVEATMKTVQREFRLASVTAACPGDLAPPSIDVPTGTGGLIDEAQAVEAAKATFKDYDFYRHVDPIGELQADKPILVHLVSEPGTAYYIVPWRDDRGFLAFSRIDRQGGWLRSVGFTGRPVEHYLLTKGEVIEALVESLFKKLRSLRLIDFMGKRVTTKVEVWLRRKVDTSRLVWKPSLQSLSPYFPLYEISLLPFISRIYVDQSGGPYTRLEDPIIGG